MDCAGLTLLIPEKPDLERDEVALAFDSAGGTVLRLGRFWDPPPLTVEAVRVYGNETFCLVLQERLGLALQTPADDLSTTVPSKFLRRSLSKRRLDQVSGATFPLFIKSLVPKQIPSRLYATAHELSDVSSGMQPTSELLVSEPVCFVAEVRSFVLDGEILDAALYEGVASLEDARDFIRQLVAAVPQPRAVVIDVGLLADNSWALVEFNAAWGAGLNGCNASRVLPAIVAASVLDNRDPGSSSSKSSQR